MKERLSQRSTERYALETARAFRDVTKIHPGNSKKESLSSGLTDGKIGVVSPNYPDRQVPLLLNRSEPFFFGPVGAIISLQPVRGRKAPHRA